MTVLQSRLNPRDEAFQANRDHMQAQVDDLRDKVAALREGGGRKRRNATSNAANCCPGNACRHCWTRGHRFSSCPNWRPWMSTMTPYPAQASSPASAAWPARNA